MSRVLNLLAATVLSLAPASALAVQILDASEPDSLVARISDHDPNRIRIAGGFITTAVGPSSGRISIEKDEDRGQIFIRINDSIADKHKAFTVFITDANGRDYSLLLKPAAIPGQSLLIRSPRKKASHLAKPFGVERRESRIKKLVRAMALDDVPGKCDLSEEGRRVPLWRGTIFSLNRRLDCGDFNVERYQLQNISDKPIRMAEQELYADGVAAVAVERMELSPGGVISIPPGDSTMVIIVRESTHE